MSANGIDLDRHESKTTQSISPGDAPPPGSIPPSRTLHSTTPGKPAKLQISESHIFLSVDETTGLQLRLREAISSAIWSGRFSAGDRLPSTRKLAQHLNISRITVTLAYQALAADGFLASAPRRGYLVAHDAPRQSGAKEKPIHQPLAPVDWSARLQGRHAQDTGLSKPVDWRSYRYPFIYGQTDQALFPHDAWRECARRALGKRDFDAVAGDFRERDDPLLVEQIVMRSLPGRCINAGDREVLVTLGAQNALYIVAKLLLADKPGAIAAVEEPGYPELWQILKALGVTYVPVKLDGQGIDPDAIPPGTDAVFVTPSHQSPTGVNMSIERRRALLRAAQERDFLIVEDDYDYEMCYRSPPLPALKSLDDSDRVIHISSFTKTLFPGLRLGYIAAAEPLIDEARGLRTSITRHPPGLTQRATAYFMSLGHYNAHARRLCNRLSGRAAILDKALFETGIDKSPRMTQGGSSVWVEAPPEVDTGQLARSLRKKSVLIEQGAPFFSAPDAPRNFMRIAFSAIPKARIYDGISILAEEIRRYTA